MSECKGQNGGIKFIHIIDMPINLKDIDFMSELDKNQAKEVKERAGIDCIVLDPQNYKLVSKIKDLISESENSAEECFQELSDDEQGNLYLREAKAYKEVIRIITEGKPILNDL